MLEFRLRTRVSEEELQEKVGKVLTPADFNLLLTGPAKVLLPDGRPLAIYLPGAIPQTLARAVWPDLSAIRVPTDNRGLASGTVRLKKAGTRTRSRPINSAILGFKEAQQPFGYCRLTAYTAKHVDKWDNVKPLFSHVADLFRQFVPERYAAQADWCRRTKPEWVIDGTPFTTITVNNTYPTGVHTDKGDLDEGFSCLAVLRRGPLRGGVLTFPEWRVGVDMQDGDLLLMDAHQWHGNTTLHCDQCGERLSTYGHRCQALDTLGTDSPERVSVVHYFRTKMINCGSSEEEASRALADAEMRSR